MYKTKIQYDKVNYEYKSAICGPQWSALMANLKVFLYQDGNNACAVVITKPRLCFFEKQPS